MRAPQGMESHSHLLGVPPFGAISMQKCACDVKLDQTRWTRFVNDNPGSSRVMLAQIAAYLSCLRNRLHVPRRCDLLLAY